MSPPSKLDEALNSGVRRLLERLEAELEPGHGMLFLAYTLEGPTLEMTALASNDSVGHYLRVLDAAKAFAVERMRVGPARTYELPRLVKFKYPNLGNALTITRLDVTALADNSELLHVWSRDGLAGELVVHARGGARLARQLELVDHSDNTVDPVEWHTIGDYRVSFDRRLGGSRFIVLRLCDGPTDALVAAGLIDPTAGHGAAPKAIFDDDERLAAVPDLASVTMAMLAHYEAMVIRLRAGEGKS